MVKRTRTPADFDSPWKDVLQRYLPAFLAFFFADIHADIAWARGYESLDKEFAKIARRAKLGKRIADKLFKVWLKDGSDFWLLIHVEVQGEHEAEFPQRMFDYNSAARRLYNKDIVSLAVLCDDRPDWRPTMFAYGRWGCKMELTFRIAKLLDFVDRVGWLEASDNPFAAVVLAHCKTIETRRDPESRRQWKLRVVKGLFRRGWSRDDIDQLFRVIDWMMVLPDELEKLFQQDLDESGAEGNPMRYVTSIERSRLRDAEEKGTLKGAIKMLSLDLEARFGPSGAKLVRKLRKLPSLEALETFALFLKSAESLDQVRDYLR